jgi:hypothetical protein
MSQTKDHFPSLGSNVSTDFSRKLSPPLPPKQNTRLQIVMLNTANMLVSLLHSPSLKVLCDEDEFAHHVQGAIDKSDTLPMVKA